ncbi:solute carrier organic anion transporter family member [Plakobranchus ocellatus]|uniref:Solute carrier organic anion transporter family member n=1 Tax=Plakobranchus ocellatus TaxID=259542 RepID=A0AAV3ZSE2_9GAST|nr:solute carrier organic anion transporter family member [Plakobranchus ocellatus]
MKFCQLSDDLFETPLSKFSGKSDSDKASVSAAQCTYPQKSFVSLSRSFAVKPFECSFCCQVCALARKIRCGHLKEKWSKFFGDKCPCNYTVIYWMRKFKSGNETVEGYLGVLSGSFLLSMNFERQKLLQRSQEMRLPLEYLKEEEADEVDDCSSNSGSDQEEKPLVHQRKQDGVNARRKHLLQRSQEMRLPLEYLKEEEADEAEDCSSNSGSDQEEKPLVHQRKQDGVNARRKRRKKKKASKRADSDQLVSIERQFNIDSSLSGLLDSAWNLGYCSTILIVGHFARVTHIPFAMGIAGIVNGLLVMAPSFIELYAPYKLSQTG